MPPQGDFELSLFQDGVLPAAFMVGLLASSPAFAEASKCAWPLANPIFTCQPTFRACDLR